MILFGSEEHACEIELRRAVLRVPLGLEYSAEELAVEENDLHLGAFLEQRLLGCLLLRPLADGVIKMRQVAVDSDLQRSRVGRQLVEFSESCARERGFTQITLHSRDTAVPFYRALGYENEGPPFLEVGIVHQKMSKTLNSN